MDSEDLQGGRHQDASGDPVPFVQQPHSKMLPVAQMQHSVFQFVPVASCFDTGHHSKESGFVLFALCLQVIISLHITEFW